MEGSGDLALRAKSALIILYYIAQSTGINGL